VVLCYAAFPYLPVLKVGCYRSFRSPSPLLFLSLDLESKVAGGRLLEHFPPSIHTCTHDFSRTVDKKELLVVFLSAPLHKRSTMFPSS